jgi:hypothetical protein
MLSSNRSKGTALRINTIILAGFKRGLAAAGISGDGAFHRSDLRLNSTQSNEHLRARGRPLYGCA